jgi:hypothetical protein
MGFGGATETHRLVAEHADSSAAEKRAFGRLSRSSLLQGIVTPVE